MPWTPTSWSSIPLASRLTWAAYRAGRALAYADAAWAARRRDLDESCRPPPGRRGTRTPCLAAAVRRGVITAGDAQLIGASRLEGIPLSRLAAETGPGVTRCAGAARKRKRLTRALFAGELEFPHIPFAGGCQKPAGNRIYTGVRKRPSPRLAGGAGCRRSLTADGSPERERRFRPAPGRPAPPPPGPLTRGGIPRCAISATRPRGTPPRRAPRRRARRPRRRDRPGGESVSPVISNTTVWLVGILAGLATLMLTVGGVRYLLGRR